MSGPKVTRYTLLQREKREFLVSGRGEEERGKKIAKGEMRAHGREKVPEVLLSVQVESREDPHDPGLVSLTLNPGHLTKSFSLTAGDRG